MIIATANPDGSIALIGKQGTTWDFSLILFKDDAGTIPFDLTEYEGRGQFRKNYRSSSPVLIEFECTPDLTGDANVLNIVVPAAISAACTQRIGVFDIEVFNADESSVERVASGTLSIDPEVTRV